MMNQLLKKLPEEYPEWVQKADGWEEAIDTYESEYLPLSEALDLEYALRDARPLPHMACRPR